MLGGRTAHPSLYLLISFSFLISSLYLLFYFFFIKYIYIYDLVEALKSSILDEKEPFSI